MCCGKRIVLLSIIIILFFFMKTSILVHSTIIYYYYYYFFFFFTTLYFRCDSHLLCSHLLHSGRRPIVSRQSIVVLLQTHHLNQSKPNFETGLVDPSFQTKQIFFVFREEFKLILFRKK